MRLEQLTFTRFLAAIFIVVFHFGLGVYPFNNPDLGFALTRANNGVGYFFILSGFIMMIAYASKNKIKPLDYYKNRFARIYPVFIISVALVLIFNLIVNRYFVFGTVVDTMVSLMGIQAWIPKKVMIYNFPAWSLSVEIFFYALFPLLYNKVYKKLSIKTITIAIIIVWVISQAVLYKLFNSPFYADNLPESHNFIFHFPLLHLNQFLMGNLAGFIFLRYLTNKTGNYDIYLVLLFAALMLLYKYPIGLDYHNGLLAIIFVPMILLLVLNTGYITKIFNLKPFVFLGEISYSIYILQWPVYLWAKTSLNYLGVVNEAYVFYIYLFVLIVSCIICYIYIEKPLHSWIRNVKFFKKQEQQLSPILVEEENKR